MCPGAEGPTYPIVALAHTMIGRFPQFGWSARPV